MAGFLWHGRIFVAWQDFCGMAGFLWHGRIFVAWQDFCGMAGFLWHGRIFVAWQDFCGMAGFLWHGMPRFWYRATRRKTYFLIWNGSLKVLIDPVRDAYC